MQDRPSLLENLIDTIHRSDCLEFMTKIPDKTVDLVFTDPPYNKGKPYLSYSDSLPQQEYFDWQREVLSESRRISKRGIAVFLCQSLRKDFEIMLPDAKLIVIHKRAAGKKHGDSGIMMQWHPLLTTAKCVSQPEGCHIKDLWDNCRLPGEGYYFREPRTGNPGQTSIALLKEVMRAFTLPGEVIFDPFMGCGSTAIAAIRTGRHFIGTEIDAGYIQMSIDRIRIERAQLELDFNTQPALLMGGDA